MLKWLAIIAGGLYILNQMGKAGQESATGIDDMSYEDPRSASDMMMVPKVAMQNPTIIEETIVDDHYDDYRLDQSEY